MAGRGGAGAAAPIAETTKVIFEPSPEDRLAVDGLRRMIEREGPIATRHRERSFRSRSRRSLLGLSSIGGGWVPEEGGGLGLGFVSSGLLYEELSRVSPDAAGLAYVHEGAAMKLHRGGSPGLRQRYLPGLVSGQLIGCSAVTEPGGGSNVRNMKTRAQRSGNGFVVNGEKTFISNAPIADVIMLTARTGEQDFRCSWSIRASTDRDARIAVGTEELVAGESFSTWIADDYLIGGVGGPARTMKVWSARIFGNPRAGHRAGGAREARSRASASSSAGRSAPTSWCGVLADMATSRAARCWSQRCAFDKGSVATSRPRWPRSTRPREGLRIASRRSRSTAPTG